MKRIALALAAIITTAGLTACSGGGSSDGGFDFFGCPPNHTYDYWYEQCVYQPPATGTGSGSKTYKAPKSTYKAPKTYKAPSMPKVRTR